MAYKRCAECGQVYDLNADYDHECPEPQTEIVNPAGVRMGNVHQTLLDRREMDAEERWYALHDGWVT